MREDEQLSPEKMRSYELVLAGIPPANLELGMKSLSKRAVWFPTPAEIREAVREAVHFKQLEDETRARLALAGKPEGWISLAEVAKSPEFEQALVKLRMPMTTGKGASLRRLTATKKPDGSLTSETWNLIRTAYKELTPLIMQGQGRRVNPYFLDWTTLFTPIEMDAWVCIRGRGVPLYPQYPVLSYFIDFANPFYRIGLELDGSKWHDYERDFKRDSELLKAGWKIFRVPGSEAYKAVKPPEDFETHEKDSDEYLETSAAWLSSIDGVVSALKSVYFRPEPDGELYRRFVLTLRAHTLMEFPI